MPNAAVQTGSQSARKSKPKRKRKTKGFFSNNFYIIIAFVIPFVLMTAAFGIMKVSPFGDQQILVTDLWHQYYPFLADLQEKLKNGESLFWSWTQGAGVNYFALMSYYLCSPLNFLTVFLPSEWLREFLMFSVVIKVSCASMFTGIFLRSMFKKNDFSLVIFGCSFAFCAFFMGYYWNTIWLDTVCLTPLVALGALKLFSEKKFRLYIVTLALSLLTNYYIGFFVCIFVLLLFIGHSIVKWQGIKDFWNKLLRTGVCTLISIGLTAFFLLPAFFGLQNTNASGSSFPSTFAINIGGSNDLLGVLDAIKQILSNFLTFIEPATKEADALPNIACGTLALVLGILFFTNKKVSLKEKIVDGCLIGFMIISCIIRQLDYIWHGFHFTNMIPYRFSYLISFVLVVLAFRAYMLLENTSCWDVILAALFTALVVVFAIDVQETYVIVASAIVAAVICVLLLFYSRRLVPKQVLAIVFAVVVVGESAVTGYIGVKTTTVTGTYDYPRGEENTEAVIDYMDEQEEDTAELWRAEMTSTQTLNDGSLNHYNGLSMFNSMANVDITVLFENMGLMGWKSGNRYTYAESSPVANLFMNVKYLIARDGVYMNTYDLTDIYSSGNVKLLQNNHYLPMGFMTSSSLLDWQVNQNEDGYNPFDKQNEFFSLATGIDEDVYTALQVVSQGHTDHDQFPVEKTGYGTYTFSCTDSSVTPHVKWNYEAPEDGLYLMYADISGGDDVQIMINDVKQSKTYGMSRSYIACIGECKKGDKISVYSTLEQGQSGSARVYVNLLNEDVFERGYEKLSQSVMATTSLSGSSMEGTITVEEDGLFYTSVPYEEGWTAYVDGVETEITPVGDALVAFNLSEGEHTIKLEYYPKGFWPGVAVSLVCALTFAFMCVLVYVIKKKKRGPDLPPDGSKNNFDEEATALEEPNSDEETEADETVSADEKIEIAN